MNKAELVQSVQGALGEEATKRQAEDALSAVLDSIVQGVKKGEKVQIVGFGTFEIRERAARTGRNPQTGESIQIKASKTVAFKASSALKKEL
jgi:DNA-binding protein HU-beta